MMLCTSKHMLCMRMESLVSDLLSDVHMIAELRCAFE